MGRSRGRRRKCKGLLLLCKGIRMGLGIGRESQFAQKMGEMNLKFAELSKQ